MVYFKRCICGADSFTFPGMFLAAASCLIALMRSFSWFEQPLSFRNIIRAVLEVFPLREVPGVIFTLYL